MGRQPDITVDLEAKDKKIIITKNGENTNITILGNWEIRELKFMPTQLLRSSGAVAKHLKEKKGA